MFSFSRWHRLLVVFPCLLLLVGSVSCENAMSPTTSTTVAVSPTTTPASTLKTPTSTSATAHPSCPASGQGRAANMPGTTLGNRQEIVSYRNAGGSATIQEFDVQSKTSSTIADISGETISSAQISQDGQWVLIVAQTNGIWALQLVRVDGQDLQTLYCASASMPLIAQWSPNQQQVIFSQIRALDTQLFLLNPSSGTLQVEFTDAKGNGLEPITWLDNSRVYVGMLANGLLYEPVNLFVLDTRKGANQQLGGLTMVMAIGDQLLSFDCSLDGKTAYFTNSQEPPRADALKSVIYADPALSGGFTNPIVVSRTIYITAVRVINTTTLMILADDPENPQSSANGLYTVQTNGSGLKQLVSKSAAQPSSWVLPPSSQLDAVFYTSSQSPAWPFNVFSQYTWSNFSRNGAYYVDGLSYGSFSGGPLIAYGSQFGEDTLVGWTTK